ncbi:ATP-binding cassette subfamily B protein [Vagococcus fluvialis]|uniref:Multidrug ABC transporter ATP-binding protein n=2 Tax=Vagococcus fluvialis TaxID=2738 RepID=A0A369AW57_9ENTE|nr:ABC transporter ATP-binding protein [Vagococcus fluvialis]MBO0480448.1 ABC transporter ATP-binding protein [Vagococcus fluvialis]MBO0485592.1 ABC transporter ATP-binding protein [Vagococcus fluvialis]RCX12457.1 ATP-binding cassette subfamily B protein [Vagococcus fluvialis]RSU00928.1 multidrug ABC transporter ATP-binding protein [Vagococcus fluvialis]WNF89745.1 ABC transporter ATP-binding protein [Vagococcus fluvialis]
MVKIFRYLSKTEYALAGVSLLFIIAQVWLDLKLPDYMNEITKLVQTEGSEMSEILSAGGMMLLCAVASLLSAVIVAVIVAKITANYSARLREKLFGKVQSLSTEEINHFSIPSLITRTTNDITQVQMLIVMGLQAMVKAPILAVWAILKISNKSWQWTFATGVAIVVLLVFVITCMILALPKMKKIQGYTDKLNSVTRENLTGLQVVRAYNAEDYQEKKFDDANETLMRTNVFTNRTFAFLMPGIQLVMSGLTLSIYWLGASLINSAALENKLNLFSDMVVFSSYAMQVIMAFMMLVMIFIMIPRASVSAKRILEVLDSKSALVDGNLTETDSQVKGKIEFKQVNFKYPQADGMALNDISFTVNQGETLAIIGATGSGKTTLVNLIARLYDTTSGEILVDDINVKNYSHAYLNNKLGFVTQKATLFSGTIASNVAFGDNGNPNKLDSDIVDSIYTAQAAEFVEKMPLGYDHAVAQNGGNLSGGQKQRLSIARAINRRSEILIFDDSFSALDYKTDRNLRESLKKDCKDTTKIIVAQRIGTIRNADTILVLDEGQLVGKGTHNELMENNPVYQEIAYSQLSKEELA